MLFSLPAATMLGRAEAAATATNPTRGRLALAAQRLQDAIPAIRQGETIHYASGGVWSTHDLIEYILETTGPCHLAAATWSMSNEPCAKLVSMQADGRLLSMAMLFDWRVQVRCPEALALTKSHANRVRVSTCHAKAACLHNDDWAITIVGSANLTNNPRIEAGIIFTDRAAWQFHSAWILGEIDNAKPFGIDMRKAKPDGRQ